MKASGASGSARGSAEFLSEVEGQRAIKVSPCTFLFYSLLSVKIQGACPCTASCAQQANPVTCARRAEIPRVQGLIGAFSLQLLTPGR